ncbi:hypothetical protein G3I70_22910, partial [Actinomadura bangladeshensis]|nr:hypothetical protein [Actinomadura bangladeshensis]
MIVCAVVLGLVLPAERRARDEGKAAEQAGAASSAAPTARAAKAGGA